MKLELEPGVYVVAVSGGVDSMVLLDLLRRQKDLKLVVAHLDHGIRSDSDLDRQLVQQVASKHGLAFVYNTAQLGPGASEALARKARYNFLRRVQLATNATAIVTAHHQDDLIETAILNLLRGTGRKGLSSLGDDKHLRRPLLHVSKEELKDYAKEHGLVWREDTTNEDTRYLRNHIRKHIMPALTPRHRRQFLDLLQSARDTNQALDTELENHFKLHPDPNALERHLFINLPHPVALEVIASWLRRHNIRQFDKTLLERLVIAAKTLEAGKRVDIDGRHELVVHKDRMELKKR